MTTIARITAIVLIILGLLILLGGLAVGLTRAVRAGARAAGLASSPARLGGLGGILLLLFIVLQGLLVVAAGEGLYLLAGLARGART